ncbi:MAG: prolipoprotein diacylglyceryl transferase [Clostridia bacterium]|nr:prolipoprotein diacylglyceryl transferase [Clostridia bacterium]
MNNLLDSITGFNPLSYSAFSIYGVIAVYVAALILCIKKKQEWMRILPCMIFSFLGLILGAKLFGAISYAPYYYKYVGSDFWDMVSKSGIVFYGGLIGYLLSLALLLPRLVKPDCRTAFDITAVTIPLFHCIARVGCFFGGCCYGLPYDGALCVRVISHGVESTHFPIMLVESGFNLLLFIALLILLFKSKRLLGKLTYVYLLFYSVFRFIIEFFRGDEMRGVFGPFSFSQYISLGILVFLVIKYARQRRNASIT